MKKKILSTLLVSTMILSLSACGSPTNSAKNLDKDIKEAETTTGENIPSLAKGEYKGYTFLYDNSWEVRSSEDEKILYLYPTNNHADGLVMLNYNEASIGDEHANTLIFAENMTKSDNVTEVSYNYETEVSGVFARRVVYTQLINETEYAVDSYLIANESEGVLYIGLCTPKNSNNDYTSGFFKVLYTLEYVGDVKNKYDIEDSIEQSSTTSRITVGQSNALSSARSYLDTMAFSYSGLIEQLEYEGYSTEDATYAADNCDADWNEQAAKSAQSYLDTMSFSRSGLIEQLKYGGFTQEQAEYGVSSVGY